MKKLILAFIVTIPLWGLSQTVDTLLYERFETSGSAFTLNTSDVGGANTSISYNQWIINNAYAGGSGQLICIGFPFNFTVNATAPQPAGITGNINSNYMHIVSDAAQVSGINNCNFSAADGICTPNELNFAAMNQDVSTLGYDSVTVSFLWLCDGGTNIYGELYYSNDSGLSWTQVTTPVSQYKNQSSWVTQNITLAAFAGLSNFRIGYRFVNQNSSIANDPGFGIDEVLITGKNAAAPPVALFSVSDSSLCQNGCVDFTDLSTGNPSSWLWIFQGAATAFSTQQNPSGICYNATGTYDVTLIVTGTSGTDTLTTTSVVVHPAPTVPLLTLSNDTLYATAGYSSYQWFLNGDTITGATNDFHVVLLDGSYTLAVTDSNGCEAISDSLNFTTGINEFTSNELQIYPKPAADYLFVNYSGVADRVEITDMRGSEVLVYEKVLLPGRIDISQLPDGIYLIMIKDGIRKSPSMKFIKAAK